MSNLRIELNHKEINRLLRSEEMTALLKERADAALQKLGSGFSATAYTGAGRANVSISADTPAAIRKNSDSDSILKALR